MATQEELYQALRNAHAAGDTAAATKLAAYIRTQQAAPAATPETSLVDDIKQGAGNLAAGLVRGAGSIGATLLYPIDKATDLIKGDRGPNITGLVTGKQPLSRNEERRQAMDEGLQMMGADPSSLLYKGGKLGGEIAGTAGAGGLVANGLTKLAPALAAAAPNVVNAIRTGGMAAPGANVATRALGGGIAGAASAGLVNPEDTLTGGIVGAALPPALKTVGAVGSALGSTARKAIAGGGVSPEVAALAKRAQELGIDIPADRLVQSKPLDALASALNYVPFSGRAATEANMGTQLNQALSRTFGEHSSNVTQALRQAESKLGGQFDSFLKSNTVAMDQQFLADLADSANKAAKELGSDGANIIAKQVDEIVSKAANGTIDGQAAYNIKKTLDRIGNRNSPEAWYAIDLKKKLMEALNRSVGPDKAQEFATLRQQYGNMLDLQKLAKNGVDGEVSVARLANMRDINNQPMQELADIAAQFVKAREGQHGAMQRAVVGAGAAATGGLPGLLGGATIGRGLNSALNSKTARGLLMGEPTALGLLAPPEALQQFGYRASPLLLGGR